MTKILLVDDTKFLRLATERALDRAGYDVIIATDGEQALELGCDRLLPKINGPEVLKALKKNPQSKAIPVVIFTGLSQNAGREVGIGFGKGMRATAQCRCRDPREVAGRAIPGWAGARGRTMGSGRANAEVIAR